MPAYFNDYFKALQSTAVEEITEHSHRTSLENLLNTIAQKQTHKLQILHEPKRITGFGAPDFKITSAGSIVGYVENKKIEEKLGKILKTDQINKYKKLNDNILLTNYIEFVWIKGDSIQNETLCSELDLQNKKAVLQPERMTAVEALIAKFFSQPPVQIGTAKKLAEALAVRAKYLKDFLKEELERQQQEDRNDKLMGLYQTFKEFVFHELTIAEFADAFAQTLAYGLFLAKLNAKEKGVTLLNAKEFIPHSFELIKELVDFLDELKNTRYASTRWIVEEALTIMNNLDLTEIERSLFYRSSKSTDAFGETAYAFKDPFIYFYEDFLAAYDKALRKAKGVYYTPPPIVNFIVRAIDDILSKTFNIKDGLADMSKVTVLDFATGTGTFLVDVIQRILDKAPANTAKRRQLVKDHILKNLYGFEYLIAPYTIAHLKLSQYLKDAGYPLENDERLNVYLTNTLEPANKQTRIPLLPALSEETRKAQAVKDKKILVITGNPPYAGHSKNPSEHKVFLKKGDEYTSGYRWNTTTNKTERKTSKASKDGSYTVKTWIGEKLMDYFFVDGKPLGERNPKWLQDDYVKFIRFAQDKIDNEEEGIVGIITNHSFLDNPTFRGMRQSLMNSFDQMYFIDLHGNYEKKEKTPEGNKDENVFDIKQGVAISILIKKKGLEKKIFHTDWWGKREEKYKNGLEKELEVLNTSEIHPLKPFYHFIKQNKNLNVDYNKFKSLTEIFTKYGNGVVTKRDKLVIGFTTESLIKNLKTFINKDLNDSQVSEIFKIPLIDKDKWNLSEARKHVTNTSISNLPIRRLLYRPFDIREIVFDDVLVARTVKILSSSFIDDNIALLTPRTNKEQPGGLVTNVIAAHKSFSAYDGSYVFPLYIFTAGSKVLNFAKDFLQFYSHHFSPEQIFGYIYAILHSPAYRTKYAEFLKIDFPRIPFTEDKELFAQISNLGWQLIEAHLLKPAALDTMADAVHCTDNGDYEVGKIVFNNEKLFINKQQYFYPVSGEVYEFYVGGYQVLHKYLRDRKGRKLTLTETAHVSNIVKVLSFTIEQMKKIEALTQQWI